MPRITIVACAGWIALAGASHATELPSVECVRALRAASIERWNGRATGELEGLRRAREICNDDTVVLVEMLDFERRAGALLPKDESDSVRSKLLSVLERPGALSVGVAQRLVVDPDLPTTLLEGVEQQLRALVESTDGIERTRTLRVLAGVQGRLHDVEGQIGSLEQLLERKPSEEIAWTLGRLYRETENWAGYLAMMSRVIENEQQLSWLEIPVLVRLGRVDEAMEKIDSFAPPPPSGRSAEQDSEGSRRVLAAGDDSATLTSGRDAARVSALVAWAWQLRDGGHGREAEVLFRRALALNPEHQVARKALLHLYGTAEDRAQVRELERQQRAASTDPVELANGAADLLATGDYAGAHALLAQLVQQFGDHQVLASEPVWYNFGIASYRTENWADADLAFSTALSFNPNRVQSNMFGGMAKAKLDDHRGALPLLQKALELDPDQSAAHYQLWVSYRVLGDAEAAARHRAAYDRLRGQ